MSPVAGQQWGEGPDPEEELAARAAAEADALREIEYQAVLRDLAVRDLYIEKTELELERLAAAESNAREELAQVRARAEELFGDLERAEATIAALDGQLADIRATRAYRWSVSVASARARLLAPWRRRRAAG